MRIALVIYGDLETVTGGFLYDKILVDYLRQQGNQVEIISLPWKRYAGQVLLNFAKAYFRRLVFGQYDLILQDELAHPALFLLNRKIKRHSATPVIAIVHQVLCSQPRFFLWNVFFRIVEKSYLTTVDGMICNSRTTLSAARGLAGQDMKSIVARPAGNRFDFKVNALQVKKRAFQPGPLRLLFVGSLLPGKQLHTLIHSLADLPPSMWRLTVVGNDALDKAYVKRVKRLVAKKNLAEQIVFTGLLSGHEVAEYMNRSHLLVMPCSHEGFGMAYIEGMAFGLPAMGSSAGAAREIIDHEKNGFLIDPGDLLTPRVLIGKLDADRQLLYQMSLAALARFKQHPTWEQSMSRIFLFLQSIVESHEMAGIKTLR